MRQLHWAHRWPWLGVLALLAAVWWLPSATAVQALEPFHAQVVRVADGDSITVLDASKRQHRIRLAGIDAPERQQPFNQSAREHLSALLAGQTVWVAPGKLDRYQRMVAKVFVTRADATEPIDASLAMLNAGLAWHYKDYEREQSREDRRAYAQAETAARAAGLGLWQERQPLAPWEFRRLAREQQRQNR